MEKGTEIVTACKEEYRNYIHIVWIGTYGDYGPPEKLVNDTKAILSRQTENRDRYLVIDPCRGVIITSITYIGMDVHTTN